MFRAVTAAPLWLTVAFHAWVTACPLAKLNVTVQPDSAAVPLSVTVTVAWKPPCHWLSRWYAAAQRAPPPVVGVGVGEPVVGGGLPGVSSALSGGNHFAAIFWLPASLGCTPSPVSVASLNPVHWSTTVTGDWAVLIPLAQAGIAA